MIGSAAFETSKLEESDKQVRYIDLELRGKEGAGDTMRSHQHVKGN